MDTICLPDYIPKNEVWIDARQDKREIKDTLFHELFERGPMARGMRYNPAHALATKAEKQLRPKMPTTAPITSQTRIPPTSDAPR